MENFLLLVFSLFRYSVFCQPFPDFLSLRPHRSFWQNETRATQRNAEPISLPPSSLPCHSLRLHRKLCNGPSSHSFLWGRLVVDACRLSAQPSSMEWRFFYSTFAFGETKLFVFCTFRNCRLTRLTANCKTMQIITRIV